MRTSSYFEKALFQDQTSAIDEYFQTKSTQLFEQSKSKPFVDFLVHQPPGKGLDGPPPSQYNTAPLQEWSSDLDGESDSEPSSPVQTLPNTDGPPCYTGAPPERWRIASSEELRHRAKVSSNSVQSTKLRTDHVSITRHRNGASVCGTSQHSHHQVIVLIASSFVHQRHSLSRLNLTHRLFDALLSELRIFPRFKDFILLFGSKREDYEIGVPQLRFRRRFERIFGSQEPRYDGFGTNLIECQSSFHANESRMCICAKVCRTQSSRHGKAVVHATNCRVPPKFFGTEFQYLYLGACGKLEPDQTLHQKICERVF